MSSDALVRALYEGSLRVSATDFSVWALGQLSVNLQCTGICWEIKDGFGHRVARRCVGTDIATLDLHAAQPTFTGGVLRIPVSGSLQGLKHDVTYYRERRDFTVAERDLLERYSSFLPHAESMNLEFALRLAAQSSGPRTDSNIGSAMVSTEGYVLSANPMFHELLRAAHRNWDGVTLPFTVDWDADGKVSNGLVYQGLYVWGRRAGHHFELQMRKDRRVPELSSREYDIACRVGKGLTFKEIGRELKLAPSTVSSHLYNLYDKLGIRGRAELVEWLSRREQLGSVNEAP